MSFVIKFMKTIRNNWKKSTLFAGISAYGVHYLKGVYEDSVLRQAYCEEAKKYGLEPLPTGRSARKITVFLNPAARKGKAKKLFDKNVAPILHVAGLEVTIVRTEHEGQAKKYMDVLDPTDAIVVAGGDGTLSEVVTGILRRSDEGTFSQIPIGVVPMGYTNTLAKSLFSKDKSDCKQMLEAALSVVKGCTKPIDVMGIKNAEGKTVYAVNTFEWGAFREAKDRAKKYWYLGPLKHRWTYLLSALGAWPPTVNVALSYTHPCDGCSQCYVAPPKVHWKWWHIFLPPKIEIPKKDYSNIMNEDCGQVHGKQLSTVELVVSTANDQLQNKDDKGLVVSHGVHSFGKKDFIKEGWKRVKSGASLEDLHNTEVNHLTLEPNGEQCHQFFIIDNEQFETAPVVIDLLKHKLKVFCKPDS